MRESLQQIDTVDGQSRLFTYTSFVNASSPKEIEKYLGGNLDEATKIAEITSDGGIIQKMLLNTLLNHSLSSGDEFHVYLNSSGINKSGKDKV